MNRARILLVEDEDGLRRGIRRNLEAEGYEVRDFPDGESALQILSSTPIFSNLYDLGIFDVMMPGSVDGFELCRRLRQQRQNFPVLFLTARDAVSDKLRGFEVGGDDYVTKPFDLDELLARVAALLRRSVIRDAAAPDGTVIGGLIVDLTSAAARAPDGTIIRFNDREAAILGLLLERRGRPVTRDEILDRVWGTAEYPSNRAIDNYIVKFRKIFEADPQEPRYFITRHGRGYELAAE